MTPPRPLNILLVEDSRSDAIIALAALSDSSLFTVVHCPSLSPAIEPTVQQPFDAILLDLGLPDSFGLDTLSAVRARYPAVPIIVLTANDDDDLAVLTAQAGADDYVVKQQLHGGNLRRIVRHVVERNALLAAIRDSEARKAAILNAALSSIVTCDSAGRILEVNRAAVTTLGYRREELLGTPLTNLVDFVELRHLFDPAYDNAFGDCATVIRNVETTILCADGAQKPVELTIASIACDDSYSFTAFMVDLTERNSLKAEARLLTEAVQTVAQGILITDPNQPDNPIVFASRGFTNLTGYESEDVNGRNCRLLQGPNTDPVTVADIRRALAVGEPYSGELLNYKKDGQEFWNALHLSPVRNGEGDLTHYVGIQVDVTQRRKLEEQLRQSQKMEAIGQLAGGVAHDFNNMLTVILGYADVLLTSGHLSGADREALCEIQKASQSAASVTHQLLAFSRKQVIKPEIVNLNAVVTELNKMLTRLLGEDVELIADLEPTLWPIRFDPGQVEQVLINISVNARDAMPQGGRLTIATGNMTRNMTTPSTTGTFGEPGRREVELIISDTGVGMSDATKSRLFEPFFTTKGPGKGTGLGLASVHGIIKQADGEIDVASELGRGTTFSIRIPAVDLGVSASAATAPSEMLRGTETILFVEDDEMLRKLIIKQLAGLGYQMLEASNGNEGLAVASSYPHEIDLLVTDLVMPQMSGRSLAQQVLASRPGVKILYISGYTDDVVVRHDIEHTAEFLQKPFLVGALSQKIRSMLD